jgi:hypothetical protein
LLGQLRNILKLGFFRRRVRWPLFLVISASLDFMGLHT